MLQKDPNVKNIICQELQERFDKYSDTGTKDLAFLKKIAEFANCKHIL